MITFNVKTLGCKVNTYESEYIISLFKEKGYLFVSDNADIYVVNTCSVTNQSDKKSRQVINSLRKENKESIIVACGCYSQNCYNSGRIDEVNADIIIGNKDKSKIVEYIEEYLENRNKIIRFYDLSKAEFENMEIKNTESRTRAFVKIEDGCNNFCSYCVIPYTRGCIRSKKHELVIKEIAELVNNGYKEIVLTGIHTGAYNDGVVDFAGLLEQLVKIKGLLRLRISSIEINELNERVLNVFSESDVLVPHLHIPLQSGSEKTLRLMNRRYNKEFFLNKVNTLRSIKKDLNITTDVIVGFPGESVEDHKESMEFIKLINFSKIHAFPYSDRQGTVASKMKEKVDPKVKKERVKELIEISNKNELEYARSFIGKTLSVLFEENKDGYFIGHTPNYIKVKVKGEFEKNKIFDIKISEDMLN